MQDAVSILGVRYDVIEYQYLILVPLSRNLDKQLSPQSPNLDLCDENANPLNPEIMNGIQMAALFIQRFKNKKTYSSLSFVSDCLPYVK